MRDDVRTDIPGKTSEVSFLKKVGRLTLPLVVERIVRTLSVEHHSAIPRHTLTGVTIASEIHRARDRFRRMDPRSIPVGIERRTRIVKDNWNFQPFRNKAGVISLVSINSIDDCCKGADLGIR